MAGQNSNHFMCFVLRCKWDFSCQNKQTMRCNHTSRTHGCISSKHHTLFTKDHLRQFVRAEVCYAHSSSLQTFDHRHSINFPEIVIELFTLLSSRHAPWNRRRQESEPLAPATACSIEQFQLEPRKLLNPPETDKKNKKSCSNIVLMRVFSGSIQFCIVSHTIVHDLRLNYIMPALTDAVDSQH